MNKIEGLGREGTLFYKLLARLTLWLGIINQVNSCKVEQLNF